MSNMHQYKYSTTSNGSYIHLSIGLSTPPPAPRVRPHDSPLPLPSARTYRQNANKPVITIYEWTTRKSYSIIQALCAVAVPLVERDRPIGCEAARLTGETRASGRCPWDNKSRIVTIILFDNCQYIFTLAHLVGSR